MSLNLELVEQATMGGPFGDMSMLCEIFRQIANAKGKEKERVLRDVIDHYGHRFDHYLCYQFSPYIIFHLGKGKLQKPLLRRVPEKDWPLFDSLDDACWALMGAPAVNDDLLLKVQATHEEVARQYGSPLAQFFYDFLTKSIKIGITAKTINKVCGTELIPEFNCMLAQKYFDKPELVDGSRSFTITQKLDGSRMLCLIQGDQVSFFSRQGQLIEGLVEVEQDVRALVASQPMYKDGVVLDGELLVDDAFILEPWYLDHLDELHPQNTSAEDYKRGQKISRSDGEKHGLTYYVFDALSLPHFQEGASLYSYGFRRAQLEQWFDVGITPKLPHLRLLPVLENSKDPADILTHLNAVRSLHLEGVMINFDDAPYVCKRTSNLLKVKVMQDCDLVISGFEEGQGANAGTLGAVLVDYKGNTVGVGSGFTKEQRDFFWQNRDSLLGRVITVQYFEETTDAKGVPSLRFPVFRELREEGKEASLF